MTIARVLTAAALFDGHDVSINIFRRLLQKRGAEVINLGHNRSVDEVITVAIQEDVDAILVSSYQGGHNEYFRYIIDRLKALNAEHILVFGGGGGVILPTEIEDLENYGVTRIYHAADGQKMGIDGISDDIISRIKDRKEKGERNYLQTISQDMINNNNTKAHFQIASELTFFEEKSGDSDNLDEIRDWLKSADKKQSVVLGVTGTGGSGKSSLIDELIGKIVGFTDLTVGVIAVDPSKSRSQGALLGDRIRYNQIYNDRVYFRSFATRDSNSEISKNILDSIAVLKSCGYDLIIVETSGIGQANSKVVDVSDASLYVMTAEFGAPSQLEKIDMLDIADFISINKFEKRGSEDAYREVMIHYLRNRQVKADKSLPLEELDLPVYACSANQFNNSGVNRLFKDVLVKLDSYNKRSYSLKTDLIELLPTKLDRNFGLIDPRRINYLSEISESVRNYAKSIDRELDLVEKAQSFSIAAKNIREQDVKKSLDQYFDNFWHKLKPETRKFIESWDSKKAEFLQDEITYKIQAKELKIKLFSESLSGSKIPKVMPPNYTSWRELVKFFYKENFPGEFPYTAGVFPFKRTTEDPRRQFAGEGSPTRTNKRFHYLTANDDSKRLSTAFDGITLYAEDPAEQPDIYGKIGEAGVSICTIDDMDTLFKGFDQTHPLTSVSMTINAPAPIMVAFYFMTAYRRELQNLGLTFDTVDAETKERIKVETFRKLRGTVQADMLKEDQGQNTIIFSIDFAMKLIGDLQEYLSKTRIMNYYSLSISGYHIAEAGANPISQLAFTLANGFTYVEYFLKRGIHVDEFAPNLSFFFSNGMDPEYSVIGRVARKIWAISMRDRYGANDKSQRLKYHIQTSGRSLHAQEIDFNDIRTTLQALIAYYDNCNSLHTNSYDEAVTTPTEESVRRSVAIQLILSKEFGLLKNENPNQGSYIIDYLTDLVEEAVLIEFDNISRRGGVLGAMETGYQRSKIQEESMKYEHLKHSGEYPIIGVNTFLNEKEGNVYDKMEVIRTSNEEKDERLVELNAFKEAHKDKSEAALLKLRQVALTGNNIFEELLNTVESCSMGQITRVLYEVGGKYRRGM